MLVAFSYLQWRPLAGVKPCYQGKPQTSTVNARLSYNYLSAESDLAYYSKVKH